MTTPPTPVRPHIHLPSTPRDAVFDSDPLAAALLAEDGALVVLCPPDDAADADADAGDDIDDAALEDDDIDPDDRDRLAEEALDPETDPEGDMEEDGTWTVASGSVVEAIEHCCRYATWSA